MAFTCIIMEIVIVDIIPNGEEIKVDAILVVIKDFIGVDVISCGVVKSDS